VSSRSWQLRVGDILAAIAAIRERTAGMSLAEFERDRTVMKAVLYDFIVIGEATRNISVEVQARSPEIPWRVMGDMRNVMAHEYFQLSHERVWETVCDDLPPLIPQLQALLVDEG
jgi:uncharacterized protein with HEPN domain